MGEAVIPVELSTSVKDSIHSVHREFRDWLFEAALPFWSRVSLDEHGPGFCEHLSLDGRPAEVDYKRLRVQARQIFVFSQAHLLGWKGARDIASQGYAFIKAAALQKGGGWAKTLRRDGSVLDPTVDLYDLAFVLLALAWYARAAGDTEPLALARNTLTWIDQNMTHLNGGYRNSTQASAPRLQNPHMHMLEAALALYALDREPAYAVCASSMLNLFRVHFKDASGGAVGEYYTDEFAAMPGPEGEHVEPGHLYEWVCLLDQAQELLGTDTRHDRDALYGFAEMHGIQTDAVSVVDAISRAGVKTRSSSRLWPQTESIKAHCVMLRRGHPSAERLVGSIHRLFTRHFSDCPRGAWRETFTERGIANADKIPASSLYHVMTAYCEVSKLIAACG